MLISLFLHLLLLSNVSLSLHEIDRHTQTLELRLVNSSPVPHRSPAIQKQVVTPQPQAAPANVTQDTTAQDTTTQDSTDQDSTAQTIAESPESSDSSISETIPDTMIETPAQADLPASEQTIESANIDAAAPSETTDSTITTSDDLPIKPSSRGYRYVESEFSVSRGADSATAGTARIVFNIDENGTYLITSLTEAKGLASLFLGKLTQKSVGFVGDTGLIPDFFSYQYGNDVSKEQSARFAWNDNTLHIRYAKGSKTVPLSTGTQDLLSFMYQFMFSPPLELTQITVTNGKNVRTYIYQFEGERMIHTSMGEMNTIHLLKSGDDEEKTELWLATDYQYLPVKIRKTDKTGGIIEQTITKIYTIAR